MHQVYLNVCIDLKEEYGGKRGDRNCHQAIGKLCEGLRAIAFKWVWASLTENNNLRRHGGSKAKIRLGGYV